MHKSMTFTVLVEVKSWPQFFSLFYFRKTSLPLINYKILLLFLLEGENKGKPLFEVPQGTTNINSRFKITRDGNLLQKRLTVNRMTFQPLNLLIVSVITFQKHIFYFILNYTLQSLKCFTFPLER